MTAQRWVRIITGFLLVCNVLSLFVSLVGLAPLMDLSKILRENHMSSLEVVIRWSFAGLTLLAFLASIFVHRKATPAPMSRSWVLEPLVLALDTHNQNSFPQVFQLLGQGTVWLADVQKETAAIKKAVRRFRGKSIDDHIEWRDHLRMIVTRVEAVSANVGEHKKDGWSSNWKHPSVVELASTYDRFRRRLRDLARSDEGANLVQAQHLHKLLRIQRSELADIRSTMGESRSAASDSDEDESDE